MVLDHGGKRDGAGRKPARGVRKETLALRVTPDIKQFLAEQDDSASNVVEDAIRRTRAFREWSKEKERP